MTIRQIDLFFLKMAVRLAHGIQRVTGLISYTLAQHLISIQIIAVMIHVSDYWVTDLLRQDTTVLIVIGGPFVFFLYARIAVLLDRCRRQWEEAPTVIPQETLNIAVETSILRMAMAVFMTGRIPLTIYEFMSGPVTLDWLLLGPDYGIAVGLYVALVPPLPPGQVKRLVPVASEG